MSALAVRCRPTVIRGLCAQWPAVRAARASDAQAAAYVAQFDAGISTEALVGDAALGGRYYYDSDLTGVNFTRETAAVVDHLRHIVTAGTDTDAPTRYLGSLPIDQYLPGFAQDNGLAILPPSAAPRIWMGNASVIACHYDSYDNLACVVAGHRRFTLYPPEAIADLYVGPIDYTLAGQPVSLAAGSMDNDRYPRFANARDGAMIVDLSPGDALYLPKLWWHQVEAQSPFNILVNYWWDNFSHGPDAPYTSLLLAMIAIAERPEPERAAWRAFFDHYVFRPDGHPLAHLPAEKHGILGPLASGNYGRIRALVMRLLRGE
ncbi:cupin-like domain-containing protein [Sphingobium sp.]|uniref:cupin-like domain-containing protein n=1 Tax=Sphingobium sp. TaxID=1912891 RepID=UPI003BB5F1D1